MTPAERVCCLPSRRNRRVGPRVFVLSHREPDDTPLLTDHHSEDDRTEPTTGMDDFECALMEKEGGRRRPRTGGHSPRGMPTVPLRCPLHTVLRMLMAAWGVDDGTSHVVGKSSVRGMTFLERSSNCARLPV